MGDTNVKDITGFGEQEENQGVTGGAKQILPYLCSAQSEGPNDTHLCIPTKKTDSVCVRK